MSARSARSLRTDGFAITAIYTGLSLARGYLVRRWFNRLGAVAR